MPHSLSLYSNKITGLLCFLFSHKHLASWINFPNNGVTVDMWEMSYSLVTQASASVSESRTWGYSWKTVLSIVSGGAE